MPTDLDSDRLQTWLIAHLPTPFAEAVKQNPLHIKRLPGGASNLTYGLDCGDLRLVLRRAPPGRKAQTAHDMVREAKILQAVKPSFERVPEVYAICADESVVGTPFFIMERLEGLFPGRSLPVEMSRSQCQTLMMTLMDLHADLHQIDLKTSGLVQLGKPEGYVDRQIRGWSKRYRTARTDDVPSCEGIMAWLAEHQPAESGAALIHNDFKLDNVALNPNDPTEIIGVVDWEMATIGDPLMDLGASMAYWVERGDPAEMHAFRTLPSTVPGMPTRAQLLARYAERTGRDLSNFDWYYVYGLFRLAAIAQQIYLRFTLGQTDNPAFAELHKIVQALSDHAWRVIRRQRLQRQLQQQRINAQPSPRLDGKIAVITGASRGIGEAVARLFASQGAHVVVSSRRQASCEQVAASIREAGGQATALACHVGDATARKALIDGVVAQLGRVDILVNNAATNPYFGPILATPMEMVSKTVGVNLIGVFHLSQLAAQVMRDHGGGVILNTASVNGEVPAAGQGIYSITKAAMLSMTRAFAKECATFGIRVNAVLPGLTETKFASALTSDPAILARLLPAIPAGRAAQPDEIAPAFLFLAADSASYVTGSSVTVDGGLLA